MWYGEFETDRELQSFWNEGYRGVMVDVGAAHPETISNSLHFRQTGWDVIPIEPNPRFCDMYRERGWEVLQYAACAEDMGKADFELCPLVDEMSCSAIKIRQREDVPRSIISVTALKLDTILHRHRPGLERIDALVVDVEGWELEVLRGFSVDRYTPKVILLENFTALPEYGKYMSGIGYRLKMQLSYNEFYVRLQD